MDETTGCHPQVLKIARNGIWKELELNWFDSFFSFNLEFIRMSVYQGDATL